MKAEAKLKVAKPHFFSAYIQNTTQAICMAAAAGCFIALLPMLSDGMKLKELARLQDQYWPPFSDLYISLILYLLLARFRSSFTLYLSPFMRSRVKDKYPLTERNEKGDKAARYVFKFCYFIVINIYGYSVLRDVQFNSPMLLGHGDTIRTFEGHPFLPLPNNLRFYYLITLAYHLDSFMLHATSPPKKDFGEMFLHHFVTVCLMVFSYISNYIRVGSLVLFAHDLSEIPANSTKVLVDLKNSTIPLLISTATLMVTWFYTRCYVFPVEIIYRAIYKGGLAIVAVEYHFAFWVYMVFLSLLVILHYYWFYLFVKILLHFFSKGEAVDLQCSDAKDQ